MIRLLRRGGSGGAPPSNPSEPPSDLDSRRRNPRRLKFDRATWWALQVIQDHGPVQVGEFTCRPWANRATGLGFDLPATAARKAVDDLVARGLVDRLPAGRVAVTAAGRRILQEARDG